MVIKCVCCTCLRSCLSHVSHVNNVSASLFVVQPNEVTVHALWSRYFKGLPVDMVGGIMKVGGSCSGSCVMCAARTCARCCMLSKRTSRWASLSGS